ncbi:hypothetical protein AMTR_s00149p00078740 [Amborella trichopoda]|uniref:Uncharacterized protein n=1 Tax=Amborella trichopoda TaxID=13333 RepID=W1PNK7_AMBTC|nr:hypothetical protein AMTR_s00149p00078740 [Amborella trichopoda]
MTKLRRGQTLGDGRVEGVDAGGRASEGRNQRRETKLRRGRRRLGDVGDGRVERRNQRPSSSGRVEGRKPIRN